MTQLLKARNNIITPEMESVARYEGLDPELIRQGIAEVCSEGQASREARFLRKDGTSVPFMFSSRRLDADGKREIVGMGVDITERKRAEAALEKRLDS